jgi:hypothetical protein
VAGQAVRSLGEECLVHSDESAALFTCSRRHVAELTRTSMSTIESGTKNHLIQAVSAKFLYVPKS